MEIKSIDETVVYTVVTDQPGWDTYHRYGAETWMIGMGESDEMVYDCSELESKFQEFINYKVVPSNIDNTIFDKCGKAIFELNSHPMLKAGGFPTDWESQPITVKIDYIRKAKAVLDVIKQEQTSM